MSIKRAETGGGAEKGESAIVVSGHPVPAIRFEMSDWMMSIPTAQVKRWELVGSGSADERLRIYAGTFLMVVSGRGLFVAYTALDAARLAIVRETPARQLSYANEPWVQSITLEFAKPPMGKPEIQ